MSTADLHESQPVSNGAAKGKRKFVFPSAFKILFILLILIAAATYIIPAGQYEVDAAGAPILLGAGIGVLGSTVNPFATGIASGFAGTTISGGLIGRIVILAIGTILGIVFVMRYADKVKKDPFKSLIHDAKEANEQQFLSGNEGGDAVKFTGRHAVILVLFFLAFVVMVYGVIPWEDLGLPLPTWWRWFPEMTACFLCFGSVIGLITDTVLYWAEQAVSGLGGVGFILVTYLLYLPLSFLISSSSGLATVSMPIMAPLSDFAACPAIWP